jgi:hypothetical protein
MEVKYIILFFGALATAYLAIIALYRWVSGHMSNARTHPSKQDIVYKDVCDERSKRLEDCIESEVATSRERYELLTKKIDDGFSDLKQQIRNRR